MSSLVGLPKREYQKQYSVTTVVSLLRFSDVDGMPSVQSKLETLFPRLKVLNRSLFILEWTVEQKELTDKQVKHVVYWLFGGGVVVVVGGYEYVSHRCFVPITNRVHTIVHFAYWNET